MSSTSATRPPSPLQGLLPAEKAEILRDLHKKHASELLALEEAQQTLNAVVLGIFSAGAAVLASDKMQLALRPPGKMGLTLIAIAIMALGGVYTYNRHKARGSVRLLLTRCEEALGCYDASFFGGEVALYPLEFRQYKSRGWWLAATYLLALLAGVGFLIILLSAGPPA